MEEHWEEVTGKTKGNAEGSLQGTQSRTKKKPKGKAGGNTQGTLKKLAIKCAYAMPCFQVLVRSFYVLQCSLFITLKRN